MPKKSKNTKKAELDWSTGDPLDHDLSDFIGKAKWHKVQFVLMPKDTTVTLRMPRAMLDKAKQVAEKKGIKYQKMLREVIADFLSKVA
jgi:predicted DNA binding CopG/RHH family protein